MIKSSDNKKNYGIDNISEYDNILNKYNNPYGVCFNKINKNKDFIKVHYFNDYEIKKNSK